MAGMIEKYAFHIYGPGGGMLLGTMSFKTPELMATYAKKATEAGYVLKAVTS